MKQPRYSGVVAKWIALFGEFFKAATADRPCHRTSNPFGPGEPSGDCALPQIIATIQQFPCANACRRPFEIKQRRSFRSLPARLCPRKIMFQFRGRVWTLDSAPAQDALELRACDAGHFNSLAKRKRAARVKRQSELFFQLGLHFVCRQPQGLYGLIGDFNSQRHWFYSNACPEENKPQWGRAHVSAEWLYSLSCQNTKSQLQWCRAGAKRSTRECEQSSVPLAHLHQE